MKIKVLLLIFLCAVISALGTYPYAKAFATTLFGDSSISYFSSILFVVTAVSANVALGAYSLINSLNLAKKMSLGHIAITLVGCFFAASVTGFMSFVGYNDEISVELNVIMSCFIVLVNTGIAFSAITVGLKDLAAGSRKLFTKHSTNHINISKLITLSVIIAAAFVITFISFLASSNGITDIIRHFDSMNKFTQTLTYLLALLVWVPNAALFINSSRITAEKIYDSIRLKKTKNSFTTWSIVVIAILSGSAYGQIALEFFNVDKSIPDIFKKISEHENLVFYFIMPMAFIISAAVNGYALNNFVDEIKKKIAKK